MVQVQIYHMSIHMWYVLYVYGMIYACGIEQHHLEILEETGHVYTPGLAHIFQQSLIQLNAFSTSYLPISR